MKCPVCKTPQNSIVQLSEHLSADTCEDCGGHWISHRNYAVWMDSHGEPLHEKPLTDISVDVHDVNAAKVCPDCGRILLKYNVGHGLDFYVEHCSGCGGVWLDKNEWEALKATNLHDELNKVFSTSWQNEIRGEAMRETLETVYLNRFGADDYAKAKEVREWLENHAQKQALLAFLDEEDPYTV